MKSNRQLKIFLLEKLTSVLGSGEQTRTDWMSQMVWKTEKQGQTLMLCKCLLFLTVTHFTTSSEVPGGKKNKRNILILWNILTF